MPRQLGELWRSVTVGNRRAAYRIEACLYGSDPKADPDGDSLGLAVRASDDGSTTSCSS